jgi:hypothetical protein
MNDGESQVRQGEQLTRGGYWSDHLTRLTIAKSSDTLFWIYQLTMEKACVTIATLLKMTRSLATGDRFPRERIEEWNNAVPYPSQFCGNNKQMKEADGGRESAQER